MSQKMYQICHTISHGSREFPSPHLRRFRVSPSFQDRVIMSSTLGFSKSLHQQLVRRPNFGSFPYRLSFEVRQIELAHVEGRPRDVALRHCLPLVQLEQVTVERLFAEDMVVVRNLLQCCYATHFSKLYRILTVPRKRLRAVRLVHCSKSLESCALRRHDQHLWLDHVNVLIQFSLFCRVQQVNANGCVEVHSSKKMSSYKYLGGASVSSHDFRHVHVGYSCVMFRQPCERSSERQKTQEEISPRVRYHSKPVREIREVESVRGFVVTVVVAELLRDVLALLN